MGFNLMHMLLWISFIGIGVFYITYDLSKQHVDESDDRPMC